jgi:hypothetical protein
MADKFDLKKVMMVGMVGGSSFDLAEFICELQGFCLGLRLEHWKTTNFELHKATEMTQGTLEDLMDAFVEACVGKDGKRPAFCEDVTASTDEDKMINCLKAMSDRDSCIMNIRDEMLQACYKYKYLKTLQ